MLGEIPPTWFVAVLECKRLSLGGGNVSGEEPKQIAKQGTFTAIPALLRAHAPLKMTPLRNGRLRRLAALDVELVRAFCC